ncbi:putative protein phosphatase 2C 24, partial [Cucurbita argyrosperma subsp. sororia]
MVISGEDILFKNFHELLAEEWVRGGSDSGQNGRWKIALTKSSERVDDAFKDKTLAPYSVGSTALVLLLSVCQIIVANCGDSMLCRQSQAIPLTVDQKEWIDYGCQTLNASKISIFSIAIVPLFKLCFISRPEEYDRLVKGGVRILFVGFPRVVGVLTMTRAIEACSILRRQRRKLAFGGAHDAIYPAQYAANQIRKVFSHLSGDNISVSVIDLKHQIKERQTERLLRGLGWAYLDNTLANGDKATHSGECCFQ